MASQASLNVPTECRESILIDEYGPKILNIAFCNVSRRINVNLLNEDGSPFMRVSANVDDYPLGCDEFAVAHHIDAPILSALQKTGMFLDSGTVCNARFYKLNVWQILSR